MHYILYTGRLPRRIFPNKKSGFLEEVSHASPPLSRISRVKELFCVPQELFSRLAFRAFALGNLQKHLLFEARKNAFKESRKRG